MALHKLRTEADNHNRTLYGNNQAVYNLLRYGVPVKIEAGKVTETVHLINWDKPEKNDFAIAEEVTLKGNHERRPDLVLYVNGIAVSVIELKNSRVSIGDGIRQLLSNQLPEFNEWFFSTVQIVFAGNDSEGLQYGAIKTEEKYFLKWKEDDADNSRYKLDKYLLKLCDKRRLIELMHDFVVFDRGVKKLPRVHQYFGVKAAQEQVLERKGGIIWHTQGSGKSIVMVLLAKWILENNPSARVAIVTDRDELDKQIERIFNEAGEPIKRTRSGRDLMNQLGQATPRLLCSLVRETPREYLDRESHYVWGRRYLLKVVERGAPPSVELKHSKMLLQIRPGTSDGRKQTLLEGRYRERLKEAVPRLIAKWEPLMGVNVARFFVQQMKTKWGSCNAGAGSIRLNTELAKKPRECLEYIVVHEMAHLLEPTHSRRFVALMDQFMPKWQFYRDELNRLPVRHETWGY